jgi:dTDP-L-rhamnose 4-epimerase
MDFARVVADVFGARDYEPAPSGKYRFGDTRHICSDVSALRSLGWSPKRGMHESVEAYKGWLDTADEIDDIIKKAQETMKKMNVVREVTS